MTYEEFKKLQLKLNGERKHKITGSVGVYDAYKWIRKNKWLNIERPLTENEFYAIIRKTNNYFAEELAKGNDIVFPEKMGRLELRKRVPFIGYKDNKLVATLSIDWDATLKLWYDDPESYENKTLVKIPEREIFKFYYNKYLATYENKSFFSFAINRDIKRLLKLQIKLGHVDAFLNRYD